MAEYMLWIGIFCLLLFGYVYCIYTAKNKRAYTIYFLAGMGLGFYVDYISFTNGYYSYPAFYPFTVFGLPLTMTIAEGFATAITIRIFERVKSSLKGFLAL